jgi:hypothetical protein
MRLLLWTSTEREALADELKGVRHAKGAERRDKQSAGTGKQQAQARPESFQNVSDVKNAPLAREQKAT